MFSPESLWWQYLFLLAVVIANAYSDGLRARRLIELFTDANSELARAKSEVRYKPAVILREWTNLQWLWHILKWTYFNVPLAYIVHFCWRWPQILEVSGAFVGLFLWTVVFRWDLLYSKPLEP